MKTDREMQTESMINRVSASIGGHYQAEDTSGCKWVSRRTLGVAAIVAVASAIADVAIELREINRTMLERK